MNGYRDSISELVRICGAGCYTWVHTNGRIVQPPINFIVIPVYKAGAIFVSFEYSCVQTVYQAPLIFKLGICTNR